MAAQEEKGSKGEPEFSNDELRKFTERYIQILPIEALAIVQAVFVLQRFTIYAGFDPSTKSEYEEKTDECAYYLAILIACGWNQFLEADIATTPDEKKAKKILLNYYLANDNERRNIKGIRDNAWFRGRDEYREELFKKLKKLNLNLFSPKPDLVV